MDEFTECGEPHSPCNSDPELDNLNGGELPVLIVNHI